MEDAFLLIFMVRLVVHKTRVLPVYSVKELLCGQSVYKLVIIFHMSCKHCSRIFQAISWLIKFNQGLWKISWVTSTGTIVESHGFSTPFPLLVHTFPPCAIPVKGGKYITPKCKITITLELKLSGNPSSENYKLCTFLKRPWLKLN